MTVTLSQETLMLTQDKLSCKTVWLITVSRQRLSTLSQDRNVFGLIRHCLKDIFVFLFLCLLSYSPVARSTAVHPPDTVWPSPFHGALWLCHYIVHSRTAVFLPSVSSCFLDTSRTFPAIGFDCRSNQASEYDTD